MIRTTIAAAALLLMAPAYSQSFYPNLYGQRFCQLREMGVGADEARAVAMTENYSNSRQRVMTTYNGKPVSTDVLESAFYVARHCPQHIK
jgi:hypothetical protein